MIVSEHKTVKIIFDVRIIFLVLIDDFFLSKIKSAAAVMQVIENTSEKILCGGNWFNQFGQLVGCATPSGHESAFGKNTVKGNSPQNNNGKRQASSNTNFVCYFCHTKKIASMFRIHVCMCSIAQ